jgi:hypothetical protein
MERNFIFGRGYIGTHPPTCEHHLPSPGVEIHTNKKKSRIRTKESFIHFRYAKLWLSYMSGCVG